MARLDRVAWLLLPTVALNGCGLFTDPEFAITTPRFDAVVDTRSDAVDDATDALDASDALDAPDASDALDALDATDAPDALDALDAPDALDVADAPDAPDAPDVPDAPDALDVHDALDVLDVVDVPDVTDRPDACSVTALKLRSPWTGSVVRDDSPLLEWTGNACGSPVLVEISPDRTFMSPASSRVPSLGNTATAPSLTRGLTYFWRVSSAGGTVHSVIGEFRVAWEPAASPAARVETAVYGTTLDGNRDGFADLVVGAPLNAPSAGAVGHVYVYPGRANFFSDLIVALAPIDLVAPVAAEALARATFGARITGAGDVNGDGYPDLLVASRSTAAWVFLGGDDGWNNTRVSPAIAVQVATGDAVPVPPVAGVGDFDRDGYCDLFVGTPTGLAVGGIAGSPSNGQLRLIRGGPDRLTYDMTRDPSLMILPNFRLGFSVAPAGDVNADGFADVVVGAPSLVSTVAGRGAIVFGASAPPAMGRAFPTTATIEMGPSLGQSVASLGDLDGDGRSEFAATQLPYPSAWLMTPGVGTYTGSFFDATPSPTNTGIVPLGDIDRDGLDEVVLVTHDRGSADANFVVRGGAGARVFTVSVPVAGGGVAGVAAGAPGDLDGDGNDDAVFSWRNTMLPRPRFVTVHQGGPRGSFAAQRTFIASDVATPEFGASLGTAY